MGRALCGSPYPFCTRTPQHPAGCPCLLLGSLSQKDIVAIWTGKPEFSAGPQCAGWATNGHQSGQDVCSSATATGGPSRPHPGDKWQMYLFSSPPLTRTWIKNATPCPELLGNSISLCLFWAFMNNALFTKTNDWPQNCPWNFYGPTNKRTPLLMVKLMTVPKFVG